MLDNPTLIDLTLFTQLRRNKRGRRRINVTLARRERQVMQLIADGVTIDGIARRLRISRGVVKNYVARVHRKLNAQSTPCAVAKCVELRLIHANVGEYIEVEG